MLILTSWEAMQYDPVEIYTVWRNVFLPSSKRKKIYTRLHSVKTQKKEISETYRVADNLRHSSLCGTPVKLIFVSSMTTGSIRRTLGVTLCHGYCRKDDLDKEFARQIEN
jgi:hypothetical protein